MKKRIVVVLVAVVLVLATAGVAWAEPADSAPVGTGVYYAQVGDTLWGVGRTFGVCVQELVRTNTWLHPSLETNPNLIQPRWLIILPPGYTPPAGYTGRPFINLRYRRDGEWHIGPPPWSIDKGVIWLP